MSIRIIPIALDGDDTLLTPDIVWDGMVGEFAVAGADEGDNAGGLRAKAALATAVLMQLMTDRAADPSELRDGDEQRGWPGDGISLADGEEPDVIGSKLWLLRRRSLFETETPLLAKRWTEESLQPLVDERVAAAFTVEVTSKPAENRLDLQVTVTNRDGTDAVKQTFAILWEQIRGLYKPLDQ